MFWFGAASGGKSHMEKFVHRHNLEHFRKLLAEATDDAQRQRLAELLAEEEAKEEDPPPPYKS